MTLLCRHRFKFDRRFCHILYYYIVYIVFIKFFYRSRNDDYIRSVEVPMGRDYTYISEIRCDDSNMVSDGVGVCPARKDIARPQVHKHKWLFEKKKYHNIINLSSERVAGLTIQILYLCVYVRKLIFQIIHMHTYTDTNLYIWLPSRFYRLRLWPMKMVGIFSYNFFSRYSLSF